MTVGTVCGWPPLLPNVFPATVGFLVAVGCWLSACQAMVPLWTKWASFAHTTSSRPGRTSTRTAIVISHLATLGLGPRSGAEGRYEEVGAVAGHGGSPPVAATIHPADHR